jgi:Glyoxalase-like domain
MYGIRAASEGGGGRRSTGSSSTTTPDEFEIRPSADRLPGLLFVSVPGSKRIKNRLHLDFRPDNRDVEVERLLALGATRADVGQGAQSWIVLADPEGNEFCVLGSRSL